MCNLDGCGDHAKMPPLVVPETDRRAFLAGLATLPLAAVLSDRALAQAAAAKVETVTMTTMGNRKVTGAIAKPKQWPAPSVVLVHEWWGLNDQIKAVAAELADMGYVAICVDLFGKTTTDPAVAKEMISALDTEAAKDIMASWIYWARDLEESTDKVATLGWCFGGGWSLRASVIAPVNATIIYYGNVDLPASELQSLVGPVLGHFAEKDQSINKAMVDKFEAAMKEANKADDLTVYWYDADHAFANPTGARYDAADAKLAWSRTTDFLSTNLL
ncbi:dienelactone hydrolase family protein [Segnochrobactrum spirostomi]|uniref:Dienelactone hydrolase family protein n=1 Tax=Segnochrobactrum spirostomi TaxID=2608987 RepID=A0A6A7Y0W0_9HYPH|nr:dienelactone hydrolase family protein [Segnochrobactrum spirostomi]MQT11569.1 dienelactone hydrolase family protein [Segnochrobactrum spirostomi]